jgi:hypothetical protein
MSQGRKEITMAINFTRGSSKFAIAILVLFCASSVVAKPRNWQTAIIGEAGSSSNGAVIVPLNGMLVGVPITHNFYTFTTGDTVYTISTKDILSGLTIGGKAEIAIDGGHLYVHCTKHDMKLTIVRRVAR